MSWASGGGAVVAAVRGEADLRFVNGGGTGSLHRFGDDRVVTELAAAPGSTRPTLFDGYDDFDPAPGDGVRPARRAAARLRATSRPSAAGTSPSGEPGWSRVPSPVRRGLSLVRTEATGEVQTPLHGEDADGLRIGDRVWMRGAKAGELLERFDVVHLVAGDELVGTRSVVPR